MRVPLVEVFDDAHDLAERAAALFTEAALDAVEKRGVFRVALSGGTTPQAVHLVLADEPWRSVIPWKQTHIFFGDERCVSECHVDRNDLSAKETLLSRVPLPPENIHPIPAEKDDAAERYEEVLRECFRAPEGLPAFDLIFLGMGSDGHTASLFPEGRVEPSSSVPLVVLIENSPKPPLRRVTLTLPVINAARNVVFLVTGSGKSVAVSRAVAGDAGIPAGRVRPEGGALVFLVDLLAAEKLVEEVAR